ncbi:MAG: lytic transglycosylase domain-containing protein [Alphaproteobacteria bacterium]|nr:MAG: lytic transglycosylase domain-containing protein [Alphaproteobacteria bacterium]
MLGIHPQRRVARQHAIIRLDVMRPIPTTVSTLVLLALVATGQTLGIERAGAQTPPAAAKTAKTKAAAKPVQAPAPAEAPAPVQQPVAVTQPMAEEAEHVARYDAAIGPARDHPLAPADATSLREAMAAGGSGRLAEAKTIRDRIGDPAARKLVDWFVYRGGYGTASEIRAFLDGNPAWPDRGLLTQRAEEALFNGAANARDIKAFFADVQPRTAVGHAALATAYLADKDEARAKALAQKAWIDLDIPASLEPAFLKRVGGLITEADHKRRLDRLLFNDSRWIGERNERAVVIRRVIALLSEDEKKKAEARLAVFLRAKNSTQLLSKLPAHSQTDWGLAVQKAQALRRQKKEEEAWKILLADPGSTSQAPDGWWEERRANAYAALRMGKPKMAYELVRNPGPLSVNAAKDASFLAGWLALRHLHDNKLALGHFEALAKAADGPLSHARGQYWLGRTYEALGDKAKAQEHYKAASTYFDTFHGQLARLKVDAAAHALNIAPPAAPTPEEVARFNGSDAVLAAVIARKAGLDVSLARAFLYHLRNHLKSEAEVAMVAHLAEALGDTQTAVRIGKGAIARGMNLVYYAYPIHSLPAYTPLRKPPEPAFILGIARQESEFNSVTLSGAGARGILQVMPVTAKHVCRDYKLKCDIPRLMKDPAYNTMLGSAYISDRMDEFTGSYVLTLAGYNAGPGRAREWIKEFGDPRDGKVDPIDWIHRIPFEETREYVQKVLSNIQVYRARLGDQATALRLNADLKRISAAPAAPASP